MTHQQRKKKRFILLQLLAGFFLMALLAAWVYSALTGEPAGKAGKDPSLAASLLSSPVSEELFFGEGGLASCAGDPAPRVLNENRPFFSGEEVAACLESESFAFYSPLDGLGRCRTACAVLSREMMPEEPRGSIGMIRPTGWHTVKYSFIDGLYLYNRCHLIGYQLAGENANPLNLITGTRQLNIDEAAGMLPYENRAASCLRGGLRVVYRVIPWFLGDEPLCRGVTMEALSLEDGGASLSFCVYLPNAQAGVEIDYATGDSRASGPESEAPLAGSGKPLIVEHDAHHVIVNVPARGVGVVQAVQG